MFWTFLLIPASYNLNENPKHHHISPWNTWKMQVDVQPRRDRTVPWKLLELVLLPLNSNSHSLRKERSSHTAGYTALMVFMKQIGWFWLIRYTSLSCAQLSTVGRASCTSKGPLLFPSPFLFLIGSKMEKRMLSNSGKLMILSFLQIWDLTDFRGGDLFFFLSHL